MASSFPTRHAPVSSHHVVLLLNYRRSFGFVNGFGWLRSGCGGGDFCSNGRLTRVD